jgi:hypothetical protein
MDEQQRAFEAWYSQHAETMINTIEFGFCESTRDASSVTILKEWVRDAWLSGFYHGYLDQNHGSIKGTTQNRR